MREITFGEKSADYIVDKIGTWAFVLWQLTAYALWIAFNVSAYFHHYDPYPFILLNLALSFQAALATSFVLISQKRQAERDREKMNRMIEMEERILRKFDDLLRLAADIRETVNDIAEYL